jgi:hypothetical protein
MVDDRPMAERGEEAWSAEPPARQESARCLCPRSDRRPQARPMTQHCGAADGGRSRPNGAEKALGWGLHAFRRAGRLWGLSKGVKRFLGHFRGR